MKRTLFLLALLMLALWALPFLACAEWNDSLWNCFILPDDLHRVEESAFEGTAAETVFMAESVEVIEHRAFADMPSLKTIYIPKSVLSIDEDSLGERKDIVVVGIAGSIAHKWAQKNGLRFVNWNVWALLRQGRSDHSRVGPASVLRQGLKTTEATRGIQRAKDAPRNPNPKDNPGMYPIDYDFP